MKLQGKQINLNDFEVIGTYDELAQKKGLRDIMAIAQSVNSELLRLSKKFGVPAEDLTDEHRAEFKLPLNFAEMIILAQAGLGLDRKETVKIMNKEIEERTGIEIGMEFVNLLMTSKIFVAAQKKAKDENPKTPK